MRTSLQIVTLKPDWPAMPSDSWRRREHGDGWRPSSTALTGENVSRGKKSSPVFSEADAAKEFSADILPFYSVGELALATGRTKETAKCWKAGRAFPNGVNLKALEAAFPKVRAWADHKWGIHDSSQRLVNVFDAIEQIMTSDTSEGRAMRARVLQLAAETST